MSLNTVFKRSKHQRTWTRNRTERAFSVTFPPLSSVPAVVVASLSETTFLWRFVSRRILILFPSLPPKHHQRFHMVAPGKQHEPRGALHAPSGVGAQYFGGVLGQRVEAAADVHQGGRVVAQIRLPGDDLRPSAVPSLGRGLLGIEGFADLCEDGFVQALARGVDDEHVGAEAFSGVEGVGGGQGAVGDGGGGGGAGAPSVGRGGIFLAAAGDVFLALSVGGGVRCAAGNGGWKSPHTQLETSFVGRIFVAASKPLETFVIFSHPVISKGREPDRSHSSVQFCNGTPWRYGFGYCETYFIEPFRIGLYESGGSEIQERGAAALLSLFRISTRIVVPIFSAHILRSRHVLPEIFRPVQPAPPMLPPSEDGVPRSFVVMNPHAVPKRVAVFILLVLRRHRHERLRQPAPRRLGHGTVGRSVKHRGRAHPPGPALHPQLDVPQGPLAELGIVRLDPTFSRGLRDIPDGAFDGGMVHGTVRYGDHVVGSGAVESEGASRRGGGPRIDAGTGTGGEFGLGPPAGDGGGQDDGEEVLLGGGFENATFGVLVAFLRAAEGGGAEITDGGVDGGNLDDGFFGRDRTAAAGGKVATFYVERGVYVSFGLRGGRRKETNVRYVRAG
mmetsp:Transcript_28316/g.64782  ORF Transcript_28316/g.64782 Transcript_28316/m.64782 type:complete len:616 (-) Transcript_28316:191-2038(-)